MDEKEVNFIIKISIISIFLLLIVTVFVYTFIKQAKQNFVQKLNAEIKSRDDERLKVASDLHDDIGPLLASIKIYLNTFNTQDTQDLEKIIKIKNNIDLSIQQVRNISNSLMPGALQRHGLIKGLEDFFENIEHETKLAIHFSAQSISVSKEMELSIFRIIQEIVTNTLKHAEAKNLEIIFEQAKNKLNITSIDDGKGFDANVVAKGIGLNNIKNRIESMQGKILMKSEINKGVHYEIELPINN
jgi:two-component system, NarL family, sensor kinase